MTGPRIVLIGYGRMGRLVDALAPEFGCAIVGRVTRANHESLAGVAGSADVAIDFSTADALVAT